MTDNWAHFNIWTAHLEASYCLMPFLWGRFDRWEKARRSDNRSQCTCSRNIFERDDDAEYEINKWKAIEVSIYTYCCFFGQISWSFWWRTRVTMKWSWYFTRSSLSSWKPSLLYRYEGGRAGELSPSCIVVGSVIENGTWERHCDVVYDHSV